MPEKALLDLLYLTPGSEDRDYLSELRLQGVDEFDVETMRHMARKSRAPRLERAVEMVSALVAHGSGTA